MDIERYRTFVIAAEGTSFAKAADKLFLSAPTVTKHISALESEMGIKLFERTPHGIHLTEAGKRCLPLARQMVSCYDSLNSMNANRVLEIYSIPCLEKLDVPDFLKRFSMIRPEISVTIVERHGTEIIEALLTHRCELAFIGNTYIDMDTLDYIEIFNERIRVAVSEKHPLADRETISLSELKNESFIMMSQESGMAGFFEKCCLSCGFKPKVRAVCSREDSQLSYVSSNMGIALFTFGRKHDWNCEGVRFIPLSEEFRSGCVLGKVKGAVLSPAANAFWNYMVNTIE